LKYRQAESTLSPYVFPTAATTSRISSISYPRRARNANNRRRNTTGSRSPINFAPAALDDPRQRRPDISLARRVLDWQPRIELEEGLAHTVDYFRRTLQGVSRVAPAKPRRRETTRRTRDAGR